MLLVALMPTLMVDESWFEPESNTQTNSKTRK